MLANKFLRYLILILLLSLQVYLPVNASPRLVRVGWYNYSALSSYNPGAAQGNLKNGEDIPGVYGGYNYEYLRMISQINDWKLQFVYGTINQSLERLEAGQVDLVGGVGKTPEREEKFAFPVNSILRTSIGLIARAADKRFTMNDFASFQGLRVGGVSGTNPYFWMQKWGDQRNIKMNFVVYPSFEQMHAALENNDVDAVTDSLIAPMPNRKVLASMESAGIYFVGNKHNPKLMQELDDAITKIRYLKPGYQETLAAKYLYSQTYSSFAVTRKEQAYLEQLRVEGKPVKVVFDINWAPVAYMDVSRGVPQGMMADVFAHISEMTGLQFSFIPGQGTELDGKDGDILATIGTDFNWADTHHVYLSQSVFEVPIFRVTMPDQKLLQVVALPKGKHLTEIISKRLKAEQKDITLQYYDSAAQCLDALLNGHAGRTYINYYELNYYLNQDRYRLVRTQPVPELTESISIGVSKNTDMMLCSIICQALRSISPGEMNNIVLNNMTMKKEHSVVDLFYAHPWGSMATVSIVALLLGGVLFFYFSNKKNIRLRDQLRDALGSRISLLEANKKLNHLSQYDTLTGIPNRRGMDEFLARVYPDHKELFLAMMDIDEFKKYNDRYGHLAGDKALVTVAGILEKYALQTGGFTARFGGEEFVWVDTLNGTKNVKRILEEIQASLYHQNIVHEAVSVGRLTISIGYAKKQNGETVEELIKNADIALYEAKAKGRNCITYHAEA